MSRRGRHLVALKTREYHDLLRAWGFSEVQAGGKHPYAVSADGKRLPISTPGTVTKVEVRKAAAMVGVNVREFLAGPHANGKGRSDEDRKGASRMGFEKSERTIDVENWLARRQSQGLDTFSLEALTNTFPQHEKRDLSNTLTTLKSQGRISSIAKGVYRITAPGQEERVKAQMEAEKEARKRPTPKPQVKPETVALPRLPDPPETEAPKQANVVAPNGDGSLFELIVNIDEGEGSRRVLVKDESGELFVARITPLPV